MTGRLLYLMGASGSGKDTVLQGVEDRIGSGIHIAPRVITRASTATEQRAISVTPTQFAAMHAQGAFAMSWQANGLSYGVQRNIIEHLAHGYDVIVNGSRAYLKQATRDFPDLQPILIHVDATMLEQRLIQRKRETHQQIQRRLARNDHFNQIRTQHSGRPVIVLDNSGRAEHAITALCEILKQRHYNPARHPLLAQDHA